MKQKTISQLKKDADKFFSKYVRYRDGQKKSDGWYSECITCEAVKPTQGNTTMYVSYAKDLFVAMYTQDQGKINLELYEQYIKLIGLSGKALKQSVETEQKPSLKEQIKFYENLK